ncbi:prolyl oligopeptidase family serine peptidase [Verrucomicrobium sp. GAS474]|uniref:prolyl oligopeptidase family serine peptidase n=1 Tax=Verrucomicrobium sp. GAS474 TaxID=1882831 RepID=UPI00138FDBD2|nr:prolyl oligopeptidase family serine peptidase [Verrucomicrobium sp. GAS474]
MSDDPFLWLEDAKSVRTEEWTAKEAATTRAWLDALPSRPLLQKRLSELLYLPAVGVPEEADGRYFYARKEAGREKAVEVVREKGKERILLDPETLSADGSTSLGVWVPNEAGTKVAYSLHRNNSDEATLYLLDVATGRTAETDVIPGAKYASPSWLPDGSGYFYTWLPVDPAIPTADRPGHAEVRFHRLGTDPARDEVVHPATGDARTFLGAGVDEEGRYLIATISHGWSETDVFYRDLKSPDGGWKELAKGLKGETSVIPWHGSFTILSADRESHGAVYQVSAADPARDNWKEIVPASAGVIQSISLIGGKLALVRTQDASHSLELRDLDGGHPKTVELPGLGSLGGLSGRAKSGEAFFRFASFTIPPRIFRLDVGTAKTTLWDEVKFPIDPAPYEVKQVFYASKDGTRVPMFIVGRKEALKDGLRDGNHPLLLSGYGGFSVTMEPYFSSSLYAWLEAGGIYAVANLRGGGEYGEEWHRAGMLERKQNVFDDFTAAARFLIDGKYTRAEKLAISGGSNGGLLVGAALTQHPELYRAVVCAVPLLDMVRYTLFGSGRTWIEEYGDPADPAALKWLAAYSPYQHVTKGAAYPAVLMLSADSDDRVDPMHARKMIAKLQAEAAPGSGPFLLRVQKNAGHGGADLVRSTVEEKADMYAFLIDRLGVDYPPGPAQ